MVILPPLSTNETLVNPTIVNDAVPPATRVSPKSLTPERLEYPVSVMNEPEVESALPIPTENGNAPVVGTELELIYTGLLAVIAAVARLLEESSYINELAVPAAPAAVLTGLPTFNAFSVISDRTESGVADVDIVISFS